MTEPHIQYCPICRREIVAANLAEVKNGTQEGYIFVHEDIPHSEDDVKALCAGIQ